MFRNDIKKNAVHYEESTTLGWNDDRLVALLREVGKEVDYNFTVMIDGEPLDNVDLTFSKEKFEQLLSISKQISEGSFSEAVAYAKKYSNETESEFVGRWEYIVKGLENIKRTICWDRENVAVYISC